MFTRDGALFDGNILLMTIEELPAYIHGDCCSNNHFLNINRDIQGKYVIGYVEYEHGSGIPQLSLNDSDSLQQAIDRMGTALERYKRWRKRPHFGTPPA